MNKVFIVNYMIGEVHEEEIEAESEQEVKDILNKRQSDYLSKCGLSDCEESLIITNIEEVEDE